MTQARTVVEVLQKGPHVIELWQEIYGKKYILDWLLFYQMRLQDISKMILEGRLYYKLKK